MSNESYITTFEDVEVFSKALGDDCYHYVIKRHDGRVERWIGKLNAPAIPLGTHRVCLTTIVRESGRNFLQIEKVE